MRFYFTKRHAEALKSKKLQPSLPKRLRVAIRQTLNKYSAWIGYDNSENYTFEKTEDTLKRFCGGDQLFAYDSEGKLIPTNLEGVIERGYSPKVLDVIEAWCDNAVSSSGTLFKINTLRIG